MVKIYIQKSPLHVIIRSALEVYNNETIGCLYGNVKEKKSGKIYIIESAQPYQNAERKKTVTSVDDYPTEALQIGIEKLVGDYHSHTKYSNNNGLQIPLLRLSNEDIADILKIRKELNNLDYMCLLITINKTNRKWLLKQYLDEVYGTLKLNGSNYLIHIKSYYFIGKRKRIANLMIRKGLLKNIFE